MFHIFCIHSSVKGHQGSCKLLAIGTSLLPVEASFGYMPRNGIAGPSSSNMSKFMRNHQTDFQSGFASFPSHQQWRSVHTFSSICCPLLFLILTILTGMRCNLIAVLIYISLMIKDVEHFFRWFSTIQYSSVENSLFSSVPHF